MSDLINKTIQALEANTTSNIFTETTNVPSMAHLAADHYHHVGTGSDMNDGATNKEKAEGRRQAKSTLAQVEHHYGKEARKDVESHTNDAFAHDNYSGPGGTEGHHTKFANKHLGGKSSAAHKEYMDRLNHHGYETSHDDGGHYND